VKAQLRLPVPPFLNTFSEEKILTSPTLPEELIHFKKQDKKQFYGMKDRFLFQKKAM
jgi:hypothetical protein